MMKSCVVVEGQPTMQTHAFRLRYKSAPLWPSSHVSQSPRTMTGRTANLLCLLRSPRLVVQHINFMDGHESNFELLEVLNLVHLGSVSNDVFFSSQKYLSSA